MPLTPLRVWQALEEARGRGDGPRTTEQGVEQPPRGIDFGAAEPVVCADWKEGQRPRYGAASRSSPTRPTPRS